MVILTALNIESFSCKIMATYQLRMIFQLCKWHFDIKWYKFEDRWADVFKFTQMQSISILASFVWVLLKFWAVISILVNSMTIWSALKLPAIAWPSPFKMFRDETLGAYFFSPFAYNFDRRYSSQQRNSL